MTDLLRLILDTVQFLWPFRKVEEWEQGVLYMRGRWWRHWPAQKGLGWAVGPGIYLLLPWFMEVRPVSVVPAPDSTALQNITLRNGTVLNWSATIVRQVEHAPNALNQTDHWPKSTLEVASGLIAGTARPSSVRSGSLPSS